MARSRLTTRRGDCYTCQFVTKLLLQGIVGPGPCDTRLPMSSTVSWRYFGLSRESFLFAMWLNIVVPRSIPLATLMSRHEGSTNVVYDTP